MYAGLMTVMVFIFSVIAHFYKYVVVAPPSEYIVSDSDDEGGEGGMKLGSVPRKDD